MHEGGEVKQRWSSKLFSTSALEGADIEQYFLSAFSYGQTWYASGWTRMNKSDHSWNSIPELSSPKSVTMYTISRGYRDDKQWDITAGLYKILDYTSSRLRCVKRKPRNRFLGLLKSYAPKNRKKHGKPQKRLLDVVE
jgi:hypothetical protein